MYEMITLFYDLNLQVHCFPFKKKNEFGSPERLLAVSCVTVFDVVIFRMRLPKYHNKIFFSNKKNTIF